MAQKKRGLGRGLESLLAKDYEQTVAADTLIEVPLDELSPGHYQPRREMDVDALDALAQSLRAQGVVQPLVVRRRSDADGYEIIAGERRWRAARMAGLPTVPVVVRSLADESAMAIALIENIQREDLNPLEVSAALKRLVEECGMTHAACAEAVGRSRASVSNLLRLADLNEDVAERLRRGEIEMGHARALLALTGKEQSSAAARVVSRRLTVRQTESLVRTLMSGQARPAPGANRDESLERIESSLSQRLEAGVRIEPNRRGGGGRVVIRYRSPEELDALMGRFE